MSHLNLVIDFARAGGGGSSGGGSGGGGSILALPFVIGAIILAWWRRREQIKKARAEILTAEASDPNWEENSIMKRVHDVFYAYQTDWSNFNLASMQTYLSKQYCQHMGYVLEALKQMNRQNQLTDVKLVKTTLFNVNDSTLNDEDNFDVEIVGKAHDQLVDLGTNKQLFVDNSPFTEIWHFDRADNLWLLDDIEQSEAETAIEKGYTPNSAKAAQNAEASKMEEFATGNSFFYNADFGWLLMPQKGALFSAASFGRTDINYHVIGKYRDVLVQFYQYVPFPEGKYRLRDYFLKLYKPFHQSTTYSIAQTVLPKTYGDILVQHSSAIGLRFTPRGMKKVTLEWGDFNKKYNVFATDIEQVSSLELLNPAYMEKMYALPFKLNLEIVGNVLYLYSADKNANFNIMLQILRAAFDEMKM